MRSVHERTAEIADGAIDALEQYGHAIGKWVAWDYHLSSPYVASPVCVMGAVELGQGLGITKLGYDVANKETRRIARKLHRKLAHPWRPCLSLNPVRAMVMINDYRLAYKQDFVEALQEIAADERAKIAPKIEMPKPNEEVKLTEEEVNRIADKLYARLKADGLTDATGLDLRQTVEEPKVRARVKEMISHLSR